jgi:hypothetical protein
MATKPLTLLEQWLDGVPNANSQQTDGVKREKKEFTPSSSAFDLNSYFRTSCLQNVVPAVAPAPPPPPQVSDSPSHLNYYSYFLPDSQPAVAQVKTENRAMDSQSEEGIFGWSSVNGIPVPVIYRGTEGLVPVRIVESKVMMSDPDPVPYVH